jgi:hypothetical protein
MNFASKTWLPAVVVSLAALISAAAQTATNAIQPLSLAEAKRLAFERNWDLLATMTTLAETELNLEK